MQVIDGRNANHYVRFQLWDSSTTIHIAVIQFWALMFQFLQFPQIIWVHLMGQAQHMLETLEDVWLQADGFVSRNGTMEGLPVLLTGEFLGARASL